MTTRAAMKAEILSDLRRPSSFGTNVNTAITAAVVNYQPKRFYFNESRSITFPTVAGTDTYSFTTIGTEFYRVDGVFVLENNHYLTIKQSDYLDLELLIDATSPTQGRPTRWAYINKAIRVYPVPDIAYTVRLDGHVKVAAPATDDEADNAWMVEAYELIKCRAKRYLGAHVLGDLNLVALMTAAENEALVPLRSATTDRVTTGQLIPTQF